MRSSTKEGLRYAVVRAVANGTDSFKSIFTSKARESLISQLKSNGVKARALHTKAIDGNIELYLKDRLSRADDKESQVVQDLLGNISNKDFPVGRIIDAKFADDNTVEATIQENSHLATMGDEYKQYLDSAWNMIGDGLLGGVSLAFNDVDSFKSGDTMFIDDMNVLGLDFVDRPSHTNTRVVETFMRAAQQSYEEPKMTNEEPKQEVAQPKEPQVIDVDEVVDKATEQIEAKQKAEKEAAEALSKEKEDIKADYEAKLQALEVAKAEAEKIAKEAIALGEQAVQEKQDVVAKVDNPFAEQARKAVEAGQNPLEGLSLAELMKLKDQAQ